MDWYYASRGQQAGPATEAEISQLVRQGVINSETLVWHAGMSEWKPLRDAGLAFAESGGTAAAAAFEPGARRFCSSCGGSYPATELAFFGESAVCPACQPAYVERLRQGASGAWAGAMYYAGFWIRVPAKIIDGCLIGILQAPIMFSLAVTSSPRDAETWGYYRLAGLAIALVYECFFLIRFGATPGKMIFRLKVVTPEGGPIDLGRAVKRYFSQILSGLLLCIGFLMAAWDPEKRTLHDRLAGTRVIRI
jgi:uncharacterized RDD family membrane protein YckC